MFLNRVRFVFLIFLKVTSVVSNSNTLNDCVKQNRTNSTVCTNVKPFDLAVVIDHSVYLTPFGHLYEREDGYKYSDFLGSMFSVSNFSYNASSFRRSIWRTDWIKPYFVKMQGFSDPDDESNLKPPYQTNESIRRNKTGITEVLRALRQEDVQNGRRDKMKIVMVLTRVTFSKEDKFVAEELNKLMKAGYKIYLNVFTEFNVHLSDVFANQSSEILTGGLEMLVLDLWSSDVHHLGRRVGVCICLFLTMYQPGTHNGGECHWTAWSECKGGKRTKKQRLNKSGNRKNFTGLCVDELIENCNDSLGSTSFRRFTDGIGTAAAGESEKLTETVKMIVWVIVSCCALIVIAAVGSLVLVCHRRKKRKDKSATNKRGKDKKKDSISSESDTHYEFIPDMGELISGNSKKRTISSVAKGSKAGKGKKGETQRKSQIYLTV